MILQDVFKDDYWFLFSILVEDRDGDVETLTEIEGVAGAAALEAVERLLFQVDGEVAGGSFRGGVERTGSALL